MVVDEPHHAGGAAHRVHRHHESSCTARPRTSPWRRLHDGSASHLSPSKRARRGGSNRSLSSPSATTAWCDGAKPAPRLLSRFRKARSPTTPRAPRELSGPALGSGPGPCRATAKPLRPRRGSVGPPYPLCGLVGDRDALAAMLASSPSRTPGPQPRCPEPRRPARSTGRPILRPHPPNGASPTLERGTKQDGNSASAAPPNAYARGRRQPP